MSDFRRLSDEVWASPQITPAEVARAAREGFAMIVNNRPDGEALDQPDGAEIERAASEHGLGYRAIPVDHSGFSEPLVEEMAQVLARSAGKVLAYCRSGTRSTFLWALAKASRGEDAGRLVQAAREAGYDLGLVAGTLHMLAANARD